MKKLIVYHATWCAPCRKAMRDIVRPLLKAHPVQVEAVDVDTSPQRAEKDRVHKLPTFILTDTTGEIWRHTGLPTIEELEALLND